MANNLLEPILSALDGYIAKQQQDKQLAQQADQFAKQLAEQAQRHKDAMAMEQQRLDMQKKQAEIEMRQREQQIKLSAQAAALELEKQALATGKTPAGIQKIAGDSVPGMIGVSNVVQDQSGQIINSEILANPAKARQDIADFETSIKNRDAKLASDLKVQEQKAMLAEQAHWNKELAKVNNEYEMVKQEKQNKFVGEQNKAARDVQYYNIDKNYAARMAELETRKSIATVRSGLATLKMSEKDKEEVSMLHVIKGKAEKAMNLMNKPFKDESGKDTTLGAYLFRERNRIVRNFGSTKDSWMNRLPKEAVDLQDAINDLKKLEVKKFHGTAFTKIEEAVSSLTMLEAGTTGSLEKNQVLLKSIYDETISGAKMRRKFMLMQNPKSQEAVDANFQAFFGESVLEDDQKGTVGGKEKVGYVDKGNAIAIVDEDE